MKRFLIVLVLAAAGAVIVGCATTTDPATGVTTTQIDPTYATMGDKGLEFGAALAGLVPWGTTAIFLISTVWSVVKNIKIRKGAIAAAGIIDKYVKPNADTWAKASIELLTAARAGLLKATMPDKL